MTTTGGTDLDVVRRALRLAQDMVVQDLGAQETFQEALAALERVGDFGTAVRTYLSEMDSEGVASDDSIRAALAALDRGGPGE